MRHLNQVGDTLVEVLLAMAIISLILGGAFASSRRSFTVNQRSQEHGEAAKLVEQQLERLKAAAKIPALDLFNPALVGPYCLMDNLEDQTGPACTFGTGGRYTVLITRNGNNFLVRATWDQIGGGNVDQTEIAYRIYP